MPYAAVRVMLHYLNIILSIIGNESYSNKNKTKSIPNTSAAMLELKNDMWNLISYN